MSHTISFRLDDYYLNRLNAKIKEKASVHEKARRVLLAALDEEGEIRGDITELEERMDALHDNLAIAVEAILIAGGHYSAESARAWVDRNLRER